MQNLIFSLNATMPVFLMMCLGWFLRRIGLLDDVFASHMNRFVFRVALPVLLFQDLATEDFFSVWDPGYVAFCFAATLLSILLVTLCSLPIRDIPARDEFIQASYRSSAALLGAAYIQNIYGNAGMTPLMIIGAVPLYNIAAVVILTLTAQAAQSEFRQMSSAAAQQSIPAFFTLEISTRNPSAGMAESTALSFCSSAPRSRRAPTIISPLIPVLHSR